MAMELNQNLYLSVLWCLIFTLIAFKLIRTRTNKSNLPPSPPKLPIIGNLHRLGKLPHRSFQSLSKKFGPLMLLHLGQTPTLVVSSADLAREMAKTNNDIVFSDRPSNTASRILFYGHNKDLSFAPYGQEWRQRRKISVLELLSTKRVRSYHSIREEEVSELVRKIQEARKSCVSVNLTLFLVESSNNVVSRCIFGHKDEADDLDGKSSTKSFGEIVKKVTHHFGEFSFGDFFPSLWWMDFITGLVPRMKSTFKELDAFMNQVVAEHKYGTRNNENKDIVDILLQLQHDARDDDDLGLSLDSIKAILLDLFAGGSETTSTTLEWAMAELMRHPEKMKKAQEEVRTVVEKKKKNKSRIDEDDVSQMSYLKCVVKETLRLHNPPALITRETNSTVKLGGYDIPPQTMVTVNAWAIQRDHDQWERPEEFVPERFENSKVDFKGQNFQFIPFGFGRRGCPGLLFGVASIEYTLSNLLYWFDWKLPEEDIDMSETIGLTVNKKLPLHLQPVPYYFCPKI
ncbi:cytochrome P450 71A1-like [Prosopis cineraria]|uniref:cytochrome P450 71A1-like n=1 Tax=Prosopis cineraria TaxID=364024 RepID=UPI002410A699|nr:cytochrome P450 71A1-like [Prosopis cineraria]